MLIRLNIITYLLDSREFNEEIPCDDKHLTKD